MQFMKKAVKLIFCKILYRVKYINLENIKQVDRCLICPNHSNVFDPTFIYPVVDELYIMAKSELFENRFVNWIFRKYNIFPINREKVDVHSMVYSLSIFDNDENRKLLMFPEGKVIKDEKEIGNYYKKGAVFIAANTNIPIIPVYITRRPKLFSRVKVIFGEPIYIKKEDLKDKKQIKNKSKQLIEKIYELKEG